MLALGACTVRGDDGEAPEAAQQALSLGVGAGTPTKADATIVTEMLSTGENPQFRGLSRIRVLPFFTGLGVRVRSGDQANGFARFLPDIAGSASDAMVFDGDQFHSGLLAGSHAHYFSGGNAVFSNGTTAALVYARATEPVEPQDALSLRAHRQLYGSLVEAGWTGGGEAYPSTADIGFSPDPIYGPDITVAAGEMALLFTEVVATVSVPYRYYYVDHYENASAQVDWSQCECPQLHQAFMKFVADEGEGPGLFPAAGLNLLWRLSVLKGTLDAFHSEDITPVMHEDTYDAELLDGTALTRGYLYNQLCDELKTRVQSCKEALEAQYSQFPQSFGLPSGAAFMRWNGAGFEAVPEAIDGLVPATRYCYMPALYYHVNTTLSTSYDRSIYEQYPGKTWEEIISLHTAGKMVTKDTRVVALDTPLQFACGMLVASVEASSSLLHDRGAGTEFSLDESSTTFPVTGIILGGQFPQRYDFSPVTDEGGETVPSEFYAYDAHIPGIFVNTRQSDSFRSLVLPTPLEREVYFYLELRNDSTQAFNGADGIIPPGSRFYLAGEIPAPSEQDVQNGVNRVFMQDRFTQLTCKVSSLENAYLCIRQMGNPELLLGVETKVNWFFSPSSYVVLG